MKIIPSLTLVRYLLLNFHSQFIVEAIVSSLVNRVTEKLSHTRLNDMETINSCEHEATTTILNLPTKYYSRNFIEIFIYCTRSYMSVNKYFINMLQNITKVNNYEFFEVTNQRNHHDLKNIVLDRRYTEDVKINESIYMCNFEQRKVTLLL